METTFGGERRGHATGCPSPGPGLASPAPGETAGPDPRSNVPARVYPWSARSSRGRSSVGRAPALQAGGHRFDPGRLHFFFLPRELTPAIDRTRLKHGRPSESGGSASGMPSGGRASTRRGAGPPAAPVRYRTRAIYLLQQLAAVRGDTPQAKVWQPRDAVLEVGVGEKAGRNEKRAARTPPSPVNRSLGLSCARRSCGRSSWTLRSYEPPAFPRRRSPDPSAPWRSPRGYMSQRSPFCPTG